VVYLEAETGALYLEKQEDVRRYSLMIDYLRVQALGPAESRTGRRPGNPAIPGFPPDRGRLPCRLLYGLDKG
jgi:hypothetical protein